MIKNKARRLTGSLIFLISSFQSFALPAEDLNVEDVQTLFYQIIALLGISLAIYLFINFRNNRKTKIKKLTYQLDINNEALNISNNLKQVVELIPYPACISNDQQKVIYFNTLYSDLIGLHQLSDENYWNEQLKINHKDITLDSSEDIIARSADNRRYKITIRPVTISQIDIQLYTVIIEELSNMDEYRDENTKLKEIIHQSNLPIIFINDRHKIVDFNAHVTSLLKTDEQSLLQVSFLKLLPEDERETFLSFVNSQTELINKNNFNLIIGDNILTPIELFIITFKQKGKLACLLFMVDISERRLLEGEILRAKQRAEESDRLKSSFLANMSHEVRTPLNSIMGFTELMCDEQLSSRERKEFHNIVKTSSNELLRLLSDIMEFSKIESGLINLNITSTYAHEIVNELHEDVAPQIINSPNIKFRIQEPIGFDMPAILTDKNRVKQTLRHLIDNALKFTYNGSVTLSYQYRPDNSVEFIVSDTGIGIPKEKIPSIFHKFRQANDDNSRDFGGAGLGLSISKHLANALGGFMWVSSIEKVGSDFHFIIPADANNVNDNRYHNTLVFYAKKPKPIPVRLPDTKVLPLFQFSALLNIPLAHDVSVIIIDTTLSEEELAALKAIPQVKKASIILYGEEQSEIIYSQFEHEMKSLLTGHLELKKYVLHCIERKIPE